ncbi:Nramp family divalent metal transporter [Kordia zhangzhouensis]|uniref:Nramp family divalent metal transporter n=1 Tax=Kordia zhangzhouensis TaxID=1620405 RepID=UPI00062978E6|nr:Nramp family divalent metal transporter [Kordia zhangzhouensis]
MFKWIKHIGPGTLVAAAFIGPGTVTVCTKAGVQFGYSLLWAMLLSIIATLVLQEMAARTGIITQKGLAEVIKGEITSQLLRNLSIFLILGAIVIGNAAYEAGNISGAALGMQVFGEANHIFYPILIGCIAFSILFIGNYKILERSLVALVLLMSLSFLITAVMTKPAIGEIVKGTLIPSMPKNTILIIIGLIGTTVVPYNLFLHASLVKEKWKSAMDLSAVRKDTFISIILGGIVSMAIIITAAASTSNDVTNAFDLAKGLEPLYGEYASYLLGIGLFAAGITSAITAPLAAAYVAKSCFGWEGTLKDKRFRLVWMLILALGVLFSSMQFKPVEVITFAQVANGLVLPIVAIFLVWIVNKANILGVHKNTLFQNILAICIIVITVILGVKGIFSVF